MNTVRIMGTNRAFVPLPARPMIVNKPVWLAVCLTPEEMQARRYQTYPFLSSEHGENTRCLVALQNESDLGNLADVANVAAISLIKSNEGDAHSTAGLLKMPVLLISSVDENRITGWMDDIEPYI